MILYRKWVLSVLLLAFICLAPLRRAQAYIDPGTGSYLLQLVLAALFGALFALKIFWTRIKGACTRVRTLFKHKEGTTGQ